MKSLLAILLALSLTACGLHTSEVQPRSPEYINTPAPVVVEKPLPTPFYYHVIVDSNSNVICVDTDIDLNYFECGPNDWKYVK